MVYVLGLMVFGREIDEGKKNKKKKHRINILQEPEYSFLY